MICYICFLQSQQALILKQSNLIIIYAALINVMLVAAIPKYFSSSYTSTTVTDERYLSIIESHAKGIPLTSSDLQYEREQSNTLRREGLQRNQEIFIGSLKSTLLITMISMVTLILLSYLNYLANAASYVYFFLPSLLIFVFVPAVSGILFLTILFSMTVVYTGQTLLNVIKKKTWLGEHGNTKNNLSSGSNYSGINHHVLQHNNSLLWNRNLNNQTSS